MSETSRFKKALEDINKAVNSTFGIDDPDERKKRQAAARKRQSGSDTVRGADRLKRRRDI